MWLVVCRSSTQAVDEQKKLEATLAVDVDGARVRISEIQTELESVIEQLGEAKVHIASDQFTFLTTICICLYYFYNNSVHFWRTNGTSCFFFSGFSYFQNLKHVQYIAVVRQLILQACFSASLEHSRDRDRFVVMIKVTLFSHLTSQRWLTANEMSALPVSRTLSSQRWLTANEMSALPVSRTLSSQRWLTANEMFALPVSRTL